MGKSPHNYLTVKFQLKNETHYIFENVEYYVNITHSTCEMVYTK